MAQWFGGGADEPLRRALQGSVPLGPPGRSAGPFNSPRQQGLGRIRGAAYQPGDPIVRVAPATN